VFSQFVSFLDLIAFRLQRAGFNICRLEGGMTPQQRDATIQHFSELPKIGRELTSVKNTQVTVFLISLKAGGVALNLTEASMVFMMDSWVSTCRVRVDDADNRSGTLQLVRIANVADQLPRTVDELTMQNTRPWTESTVLVKSVPSR